MSEVVAFPKKTDERLLWRCNCNCFTHYAHADSRIECAACGTVANGYGGEWRLPLPPEPDEPKNIEPGDRKVTDLDSPEQSMKRLLKRLTAKPTGRAAIMIVNQDGSTEVWAEDFDTDERREWITGKLDMMLKDMTSAAKGTA